MQNRTLNIITSSFLAISLAGCASNLTYQEALDKNRRLSDNTEKVEDAEFIVEAQSFNLLETRINQLAVSQGYSADLVNFAKRNAESHKKLSKEISKLSRKEKIKIPGSMKEEHRRMLDELESTGRSDFDMKFVDIVKRVNEENTELFEEQSSEANDADIRAFAARKLGLFRAHADELDKVDDQLMHTHR